MAAANTDKLRKLSRRWVSQIGSGGVADENATTIPLSSTTNLPTDTAVTLVIDRVDANGTATPTLEETIVGVVSSTNIVNAVRGVEGTAQAHSAGAVVEVLVTADGYNDIIDHLLVEHGQDGKHTKVNGNTVTAGTDTVALLTASQTLTNKTLTSPLFQGTVDGWTALGACTYEASDDPTYTFSFASDMTGVLSPGMRIKLTDSTVQYFIVTAVGAYSGGKTIITGYGGTDYNLTGGAITLPYYSTQKAPQGFPLDPAKWSVVTTDTSDRSTNTPTQNQFYNISTLGVTLPIGVWNINYSLCLYVTRATNGIAEVKATLSTANNSESSNVHTLIGSVRATTDGVRTDGSFTLYKVFPLTLAAKTAYYTNLWTPIANITAIGILNGSSAGTIRAICAYL